MGLLLVSAVYAAGSPALDAPWIQGDEYVFIVNYSDVTGAGRTESTWLRWASIFGHVHEDLYQPVPILTYAIEWSLWRTDKTLHIRRTDVLLHAVNALLLWAVLGTLLNRREEALGHHQTALAWSLAMIWALHPVLVTSYAGDMGRTHILSATFALLSLRLHVQSLRTNRWGYFAAAVGSLVLAMMSKPIVGWVGLVLALEWATLGLRATLRSPRVYIIATICLLFTWATLHTSREAGLIVDAELALFGDPISRSLLAVWIYCRNIAAPWWWMSTWYLPDIHTSWSYPLVWVGVILAGASAGAVWLSARRRETRGVAVGLLWFWALLLPVIGVVGGRVAAAQDRYLYQPLCGLLLALGVLVNQWVGSRTPDAAGRRTKLFVAGCMLVCVPMLVWDAYLCHHARTTLRRAERVIKLNPTDPRVKEMLAVAYDFSHRHEVPERNVSERPDFEARYEATLLEAALMAEQSPHYFRDAGDRAAFHRRISFRLLRAGNTTGSLAQAERAHDFEPDTLFTWTRLAHAYRALQRWDDALAAYQKLEPLLPDDDKFRPLRLAEFGDLLLHRLQRPAVARRKYRAVLEIENAPADARLVSAIGLAICEIRAGQGEVGQRLLEQVLQEYPGHVGALLALGEYHLRSHHWRPAAEVYGAILRREPAHARALLGFHEACSRAGRWLDAAFAWQDAVENQPGQRLFRSFLVWSAACAGDESARRRADRLLEQDAYNPLACFARMLLALRAGRLDEADEWARAARKGTPIPRAHAHRRAALALSLMRDRNSLPPESAIVEATIWAEGGDRSAARALLEKYLDQSPDADASELARARLERLGRAAETP